MRKLVIFVVESKSKDIDSDGVYIRNTLDHFYTFNKHETITKFVFMDGKGNYNSPKVIKNIEKHIKSFKEASYEVIYVCDTDQINRSQEHVKNLKKINDFCKRNKYRLILMNYDVEDVYWGTQVEKKQKIKEAIRFASSKQIEKVVEKNLMNRNCTERHKSNILCVLDEIFERK